MYPPSLGQRRQRLHFVWQIQRVDLGEPGVLQRGSCREPLVGVAREEAAEDLEPFLRQLRLGEQLAQVVLPLHVGQLRRHHHGGREPRPCAVVGRAEQLEDRVELPLVVGTLEERSPAVDQLRHDAAEGPDVDLRVVVGLLQQHLGRHVPQRAGRLVRRPLVGGHGEPKVADLDDVMTLADEDVLGLDVAVDDAAGVHLLGGREQLPHGGADRGLGQRRAPAGELAEDVVEAGAHEVHDEAEVHGARGADDAVEADDERVGGLLEEARLPQRRPGAAVGRAEALDGDDPAGVAVPRLDDRTEGTLAEAAGGLLVLLRAADGDAPPLEAGRSRGGVAAGGGGGLGHRERFNCRRRDGGFLALALATRQRMTARGRGEARVECRSKPSIYYGSASGPTAS
jgi:hypothetical protein